MKPGDLIAYSAAGQRHKTLGMIVSIYTHQNKELFLILWGVIGEYMPRVYWEKYPGDWGQRPKSGKLYWHENGGWFVNVNEE